MGLFKIGEFSTLSQISSKTLRYYDDIGLLKPAHTDPFTSYRYYSVEQLSRLNRIIALKELGFDLEQIARLLADNISAAQLQGMLQLKQAEIERHIAGEQQRLLKVQARLRQIAKEGEMTHYDIVLRQLPALAVASIRERIPHYGHFGELLGRLLRLLGERQIVFSGSPQAIYHDGEYREENPDVEVCLAVEHPDSAVDQPIYATLPAVKVVSTIHTGDYTDLSSAYAALMHWIAMNAYEITGPNREIYLRGPKPGRDPQEFVTEIQIPIDMQKPT